MALRGLGLKSAIENEIFYVANHGRSGINDKREKRQDFPLSFGHDLVLLSWPDTEENQERISK